MQLRTFHVIYSLLPLSLIDGGIIAHLITYFLLFFIQQKYILMFITCKEVEQDLYH